MSDTENLEADEQDGLKALVDGLKNGIIMVAADGHTVWVDPKVRERMNGGLSRLDFPLEKTRRIAVECFISPETVVTENGPLAFCVIQQTDKGDSTAMSAIEAVLAETSEFARSIVEHLKDLSLPRRDTPSSELNALSHREREILSFVLQGRSDLEMSTAMGLSPNTVRNHVASLYRKIGVNRRSAAVIWARERGISAEALKSRSRGPQDSH